MTIPADLPVPAYRYRALIRRWVDGDTVDVDVDLGFHVRAQVRVRVYGIDTPERGHPGALEATAAARELAPEGGEVWLSTYKQPGKYGRWLGVLATPRTTDLALTLIAAGHGTPYYGGARA